MYALGADYQGKLYVILKEFLTGWSIRGRQGAKTAPGGTLAASRNGPKHPFIKGFQRLWAALAEAASWDSGSALDVGFREKEFIQI